MFITKKTNDDLFKKNTKEYVRSLKKSEISSDTLRVVAIAFIILATIVDFYNIHSIVITNFDISSDVLRNPFLDLFQWSMPLVLTLGITLLFSFSSLFIGNLYRKSITSSNKFLSRIGLIVLLLFLVAVICAITYWRFSSEILSSPSSYNEDLTFDPVAQSNLFTAIMIFGCLVSILYGIFGHDIDAELFTKQEKSNLHQDEMNYKFICNKLYNAKIKESNYNERLGKCVNNITDSFAEIENILHKLSIIDDPSIIKIVEQEFTKAKSKSEQVR